MFTENMDLDFSRALIDIRLGKRLSREAWEDSGVYVVFQRGYPDGIGINANTAEATGIPEGTVVVFKRYLMQRTADGSFMPWTPNQDDLLSSDWFVSGMKGLERAEEGE